MAPLIFPLRWQRPVLCPHSLQLCHGAIIPRGTSGGVQPEGGDLEVWCMGRVTMISQVAESCRAARATEGTAVGRR